MLDAFFIEKVFYLSVLEFGVVVTSIFLTLASNLFCAVFKNFFSTS
jgi:hypothetical protein